MSKIFNCDYRQTPQGTAVYTLCFCIDETKEMCCVAWFIIIRGEYTFTSEIDVSSCLLIFVIS